MCSSDLFIEPDLKRAVRLAAVVRAIAVQGLARLPGDSAGQQLTGDLADIDVGDLAVIGVDIYCRGGHDRTFGGSTASEFGSLIA